MAALYHHHALFHTPDVSPQESNPTSNSQSQFSNAHTRTVSAVPLLKSASDHSNATELLSDSASQSYLDILSRQPTHPDGPSHGWDLGLNLLGDQITPAERKCKRDSTIRKRIQRFRGARNLLELIIVIWALYTSIRYLLAFMIVNTSPALLLSLSLGVASTLSATLVIVAYLIPKLHYPSPRQHPRLVMLLRLLCSILLVTPATVNTLVLFVNRTSLRVDTRCHWDIDVIWSDLPASFDCPSTTHPSFTLWVVSSAMRLGLTTLVGALYIYVSHTYQITRRPFSYGRRKGQQYDTPRPHLQPAYSVDDNNTLHNFPSSISQPPSHTESTSKYTFHTLPQSKSQNAAQSSSSTLVTCQPSPPENITSVLPNENASVAISIGSSTHSSHTSNTASLPTRQISSPGTGASDNLTRPPVRRANRRLSSASDEEHLIIASPVSDTDPHSFASRLRTFVSQVTRETNEGLRIARVSQSSRDSSDESDSDDNGEGVTWSLRHLDTGLFPQDYRDVHDEHGLGLTPASPPGPPSLSHPFSSSYTPITYPGLVSQPHVYSDDRISIFGRSIQRMPTIESLGSREIPSSIQTIHSVRSSWSPPMQLNNTRALSPTPSTSRSTHSALTTTTTTTSTSRSMHTAPSLHTLSSALSSSLSMHTALSGPASSTSSSASSAAQPSSVSPSPAGVLGKNRSVNEGCSKPVSEMGELLR